AEKEKEPLPEITEEDKEQIIAIADKLCFNKQLTNEEKSFKVRYSPEIAIQVVASKALLSSSIDKFLSGSTDFTEDEKEVYDSNQEDIDVIVEDRKYLDSIINKITSGISEFTTGELQYQANNAKVIEAELNRLK